MKSLLLLTVLAVIHLVHCDDYCFGKDRERPQTRHFSSKTAYQIVVGSSNIEKQVVVPSCQPDKIWIYHRHGTRLPAKRFIEGVSRLEELRDEIVKNYRVRNSKPDSNALCREDLIALQMWHWNSSIQPDQANFLTSQGYDDLRGTARLYQRYFPTVMTRPYQQSDYLFRHTDTQRTEESFKAFAEGLFGSNQSVKAESVPEKDLLLRPYDYCESWKKNDHGPADVETDKFRNTILWKEMVQDVSTRLGFLYNLTDSDIEDMYDICRYEQAWHIDRTSVWCAAFLPNHVTLLEYNEDLKYYYKLGYGYSGNQRLSCRAVKDMLSHLNDAAQPKVLVNFGHSSGVQTFLTALGINKDDIPLMANNFDEQTNRRFQTSKNDPFAANFLAVKFICEDAHDPEKVLFFLNQNAVNLDWCNVGLCNWREVQQRFKTFMDTDCDDYYCSGSYAAFTSGLVLLFAASIYLIF